MKIVKIKQFNSDLELPQYQTPGSVGMDLRAAINHDIILQQLERRIIPTGIAIALPKDYEAQIRPRSGLAIKFGITVVNAPGTIDSDYRGEIRVCLINFGKEKYTIIRGMRIAQIVFAPIIRVKLEKVDVLNDTERGDSGFGSTGYVE